MVENTSGQLQKLTNDFSTMVQETIDNSHTSMQSQQEALNDFSKIVRESIDNSHTLQWIDNEKPYRISPDGLRRLSKLHIKG